MARAMPRRRLAALRSALQCPARIVHTPKLSRARRERRDRAAHLADGEHPDGRRSQAASGARERPSSSCSRGVDILRCSLSPGQHWPRARRRQSGPRCRRVPAVLSVAISNVTRAAPYKSGAPTSTEPVPVVATSDARSAPRRFISSPAVPGRPSCRDWSKQKRPIKAPPSAGLRHRDAHHQPARVGRRRRRRRSLTRFESSGPTRDGSSTCASSRARCPSPELTADARQRLVIVRREDLRQRWFSDKSDLVLVALRHCSSRRALVSGDAHGDRSRDWSFTNVRWTLARASGEVFF